MFCFAFFTFKCSLVCVLTDLVRIFLNQNTLNTFMNFDDVVTRRRTIRKYLTIPVEKDKWTAILEAGAFAPTSGNLQPWKIIIVEDATDRAKLASICHDQQWMAQAPIHFIVCADTNMANQYYGKRGEMLYATQDCAAYIQNMLLKATDLGLASTWVGSFDEERLRVFFGVPPSIRPQAIITVGYGDEVVPMPPKSILADFCYFDRYGKMGTNFGNALRFWNFSTARELVHKDISSFWSDLTDKFVSRATSLSRFKKSKK